MMNWIIFLIQMDFLCEIQYSRICAISLSFPRNALLCQWKCDKEMDTSLPKLGSGTAPDDCPVRGADHSVSVKRKS